MTRLGGLVVIAMIGGCGAAPQPVCLDCGWPDGGKRDDYGAVTRAWTRHDDLNGDYQEVIAVDATFKSPAWRAAYVAREARNRGLDATAVDKLRDANKTTAEQAHEFELIVTTWDRKENELHRPGAVWKLTLIDDQGKSYEPTKITRDKRPKSILRAEFPQVGDFAEAYVASFPVVIAPGTKSLRLRVASARGDVELRWDAR